MGKPDGQQRGLAGEYYVASTLSRLGYDIGMTLGRAKVFDIMAHGTKARTINIQVKSTYCGYDWLAARFDTSRDSVVALVRLGRDATQKPELYFLRGERANRLITHKYKKHSPRISRADVRRESKDHDFKLIELLLEKKNLT